MTNLIFNRSELSTMWDLLGFRKCSAARSSDFEYLSKTESNWQKKLLKVEVKVTGEKVTQVKVKK